MAQTSPPPHLPPRADQFSVLGWDLIENSPALQCHYECSRFGAFTETITWEAPISDVHDYLHGPGQAIGDLLTVAVGVSYYKAGAASRITLPPLSKAGQAMGKALYTEGLAEFFVRAHLPYPADIEFLGDVLDTSPAPFVTPAPGPALVAFGGGKDSYVAKAIIEAQSDEVSLCSVVLGDAVRSALQATAPSPLLFLKRTLDPRLKEVTPKGFNGHVPITAINMLVLIIQAAVSQKPQVIFANERSADEPTIDVEGVVANHQYSKSSAFEALMRAAIAEADPAAPTLYSVLRPFSELWIGRAFAQLKTPFSRFTSCNRNFRLAGDATKRWCGECAKCAFTSLILAPFITEGEAMQIFGENFLNRSALQPLYQELCGLTDHKPWDCVGTITECRLALWRASQRPEWADSLAVKNLLPQVKSLHTEEELHTLWAEALTPWGAGVVPPAYMAAAKGIAP